MLLSLEKLNFIICIFNRARLVVVVMRAERYGKMIFDHSFLLLLDEHNSDGCVMAKGGFLYMGERETG